MFVLDVPGGQGVGFESENQIWQAASAYVGPPHPGNSREVKTVGDGADNQVAGVRQLDG